MAKDTAWGRFSQAHPELVKFVKFSLAGGLATVVEFIVYYILQGIVFKSLNTEPVSFWIFEYEGLGYLWAFLISTTIGYAIAFVLNRKVTFHADANPGLSIFLYFVMVVITIILTTLIGMWIMNLCIENDMRTLGEVIAKPIAAGVAFVWTYPTNRFIIHRKKKPEAEAQAE
ncbi:MAG: GtrA family protein [Clostridiales bacterium]|nr:GtrA family protein [Clostridiales bacterium]